MPVDIEVEGLEEIRRRMRKFPRRLNKEIRHTMNASLDVLHENVPSYPPQPQGSTYRRTMTLGRSIGVERTKPDIYDVKKQGQGKFMAEFGTRLDYAPHVIGEAEQASHMGHWWTVKTIASNAKPKIIRLFKDMARDLAKWLDRKGLL